MNVKLPSRVCHLATRIFLLGSFFAILATSQPPEGLISLRLAQPWAIQPGGRLNAHIWAYEPYSHSPISGAELVASWRIDGSSSGPLELITDDLGHAILTIDVPIGILEGLLEVSIEASDREGKRRVEADTYILDRGDALLSTDRRIYRPGQEVQWRGLWRDSKGRALARSSVQAEILDPLGSRVSRSSLETSELGIASSSWSIPEASPAGVYRLQVGAREQYLAQEVEFHVGRLELPRFRILAESDQSWYDLDEEVSVTIKVRDLLGRPLGGAAVTIRQPPGWQRSQKELATGRLQPDGQVSLSLDPIQTSDWLKRDDGWLQFDDVKLVAAITDPLTGESEEKTFSVRVSRQSLHVYLIQQPVIPGLPGSMIVSCYLPNGEPRECDVTLRFGRKTDAPSVVVRTGPSGLAPVTAPRILDEKQREGWSVQLLAQDASGASGRRREFIQISEQPLEILTEETLVRPGQDLRFTLHPREPLSRVLVEARQGEGGAPVASSIVEDLVDPLRMRLPLPAGARGPFLVTALPMGPLAGAPRSWIRGRTFFVIDDRPLDFRIETTRESYRPGETAQIAFELSSLGSLDDEAVFAVAVVDAAVESRAESLPGLRPAAGSGLLAGLALFEDGYLSNEVTRGVEELEEGEEPSRELDLLAQADLLPSWGAMFYETDEDDAISSQKHRYRGFFAFALDSVHKALEKQHVKKALGQLRNLDDVISLLARHGADPTLLRDPWGSPYRLEADFRQSRPRLRFHSLGMDRCPDTLDDFLVESVSFDRFAWIEHQIACAVEKLEEEGESLPRDEKALLRGLARCGISETEYRQAWPAAVHLESQISGPFLKLEVLRTKTNAESNRPVRRVFWKGRFRWGNTAGKALLVEAKEVFLRDPPYEKASEVEDALDLLGPDPSRFRDPWNEALFWQVDEVKRYADVRALEKTDSEDAKAGPLTATVTEFLVRVSSSGPDGRPQTEDDLILAHATLPSRHELSVGQAGNLLILSYGKGAVIGLVVDETGASLPGTAIDFRQEEGPLGWTATTDALGRFIFQVPPGIYRLEAKLDGFSTVIYETVVIETGRATRIELALQAAIEDVITVTSESPPLATKRSRLPLRRYAPMVTPRLRKSFQETLLWLPEESLNQEGPSRVQIQLADNLTTWNIAALASTRDGRIVSAQTQIRSELPLSVEARLPSLLTQGDRVALPVLAESRLEEPVEVVIRSVIERGGELIGPSESHVRLEPKASERLDLPVSVTGTEDLILRVHGEGQGHADASERRTEVRPDGQPVEVVASRILRSGSSFHIELPNDMMEKGAELEILVTRDLLGQLQTASEALQQRPVGCSEQVLSAAFPSLLLLELGKSSDSQAGRLALKHLTLARDTLLGRRGSQGGLSYWNSGRPDPALTALGIDFLSRSSQYLSIDDEVIEEDVAWLQKKQHRDGFWRSHSWNPRGAETLLTAWITRVLAKRDRTESDQRSEDALERAFAWLERRMASSENAYGLASYALALAERERREELGELLPRLKKLASRAEDGTIFWEHRSNTPFYGWGRGARIETTALVLRALVTADQGGSEIVRDAASYLVRERDASGAWTSTQATIQALEALIAALPESESDDSEDLEVRFQGDALRSEPQSDQSTTLRFLAPGRLSGGSYRIDVEGGGGQTFVRAVARFHRSWKPSSEEVIDVTGELRLDVDCGTEESFPIGSDVTCSIEAERIGFRGYGMMIAEIGLPPGADVDTAHLENQVATVSAFRYFEAQADKVVLYLWPRAGGTELELTFRPRLALCAKGSPSQLYDYYNAESRAIRPPDRFEVFSPNWPDPCGDGKATQSKPVMGNVKLVKPGTGTVSR